MWTIVFMATDGTLLNVQCNPDKVEVVARALSKEGIARGTLFRINGRIWLPVDVFIGNLTVKVTVRQITRHDAMSRAEARRKMLGSVRPPPPSP